MRSQSKIIITDLDGTIMNIDHRVGFAVGRNWDVFHELAKLDTVNIDVFDTLMSLRSIGHDIIVVTGRPERYREQTTTHLNQIGFKYLTMLMREDDDVASDIITKPRLLREYFGSMNRARERVLMVLDDRANMVACWRKLGFNCWQVREGQY